MTQGTVFLHQIVQYDDAPWTEEERLALDEVLELDWDACWKEKVQ